MKKTLLILVLVMAVFTGQIFAFAYANHGCRAYNNCGDEGTTAGIASIMTLSIGQLSDQGAGYFLLSHSDFSLFLNKVEMSELNGLNYQELQVLLDSAIANMEGASYAFSTLIQLALEKPYNPVVLNQLKHFNYQGYMTDNGLNSVIFSSVKACLAKGDVTGAYIKLKADMDDIIQQLYIVKAGVDLNIFPDISQLWRVSQSFSDSKMFGQYMSEVMMNL